MNASELEAHLDGPILHPEDPGFDEARSLWNTRFDRRPQAIARVTSTADVAGAVRFAAERGLDLSVRGGGHAYAAQTVADGGLLIDLAAMDDIEVDAGTSTARIGPGVTCADLDAATQSEGLAVPLPTVSSVGVIGAALGGGSGYLARRFGLTLDNVVAAEVVTASGEVIEVSEDAHPDLFWAIRGGGGNFGVVTSMTLRLHEVGPEVLGGQVIYSFDDADRLLRAYRDFMQDAPRDLQCYAFCFRAPPIDLFPADTHGHPVLDFVICHQDPDAADAVQAIREFGEPVLDLVGPAPYTQVQQSFDANLPKGHRYLSRAHDLAELSDGAIATMVEHVPDMAGAFTAAYFDPLGGAIADVGSSETAFAGRGAAFGFHIIAGWMEPEGDEAVIDWTTAFADDMAEHATGGVYVNLIGDDEMPERVSDAYGPNYDRLVRLKRRWDPTNLFGNNYNIPPD